MTEEVPQENTVPEVTETPETTETPQETPEVAESSPATPKEPVQTSDEDHVRKRIDKIVWQREEALRKAARLEEENMRLKTAQAPKQEAVDPNRPRQDDPRFSSWDEYAEALAEWKVESRLKNLQQEYQKRNEQERFQSSKKTFEERAEKVREKFPDYDELFERAPISEAMAPTILESEQGPELAVYLSKNPDVARKIYNLSPREAARELGKIEAKLDDLLKLKTVTEAKPPLSPVRPKGENASGLDDSLDIKEWTRRRNKQLGR